ncbi:MAG: hypothetical protein GY805_05610 [Chloroflexi bacterium]|nr:hypothetical protein [Chloroflexota bacterium]
MSQYSWLARRDVGLTHRLAEPKHALAVDWAGIFVDLVAGSSSLLPARPSAPAGMSMNAGWTNSVVVDCPAIGKRRTGCPE